MNDSSGARTLARFDMRCMICAGAAVEQHHLINRSQGGKDGPTVWLCSEHHREFTEERWLAYLDDAEFKIAVMATGEVIWQQSLGVDGKRAFANLHTAREALEEIPQYISYLQNDQLVALFQELRDVGKRGWACQCAIIAYALTFRFVRGTKLERAKALAAELRVSVPTLYDYAGAWLTFQDRLPALVEAFEGRTSFIVEAARHEDADTLIDEAAEEFQARPYSLAEFRARIRGEDFVPKRCAWLGEDGQRCERYLPKGESA